MTLKQTCKRIGITVQQYQKWLKRAKDAKCEYFFITHERGDMQPYPYHIAKRENIEEARRTLKMGGIQILLEVMI